MKILWKSKTMFIMGAAAMLPFGARAGDREWATAGKIMAGIIGMQVVSSMIESPREVIYETRYVSSCEPVRYVYTQPPPPVVRYVYVTPPPPRCYVPPPRRYSPPSSRSHYAPPPPPPRRYSPPPSSRQAPPRRQVPERRR